jgi:hypothetical protein
MDEPAWVTVEELVASRWIPALMTRAPLPALRGIDRALAAREIEAIAQRNEPLAAFTSLEVSAEDIELRRMRDGTFARVSV